MASASTKAGSFFSSPLWKRVFSRSSTSPSFIAATAAFGLGADAVLGEGDRPAEDRGDRRHDLAAARISGRAVLRPAEMGEQDRLAALAGDLADGRRDGADARVVGDLAVGHRHVEVDADEDALALEVAGVVEGAECGHGHDFTDIRLASRFRRHLPSASLCEDRQRPALAAGRLAVWRRRADLEVVAHERPVAEHFQLAHVAARVELHRLLNLGGGGEFDLAKRLASPAS